MNGDWQIIDRAFSTRLEGLLDELPWRDNNGVSCDSAIYTHR